MIKSKQAYQKRSVSNFQLQHDRLSLCTHFAHFQNPDKTIGNESKGGHRRQEISMYIWKIQRRNKGTIIKQRR